jgi:two-component system chemotaxis response regulator CheB
MIKVLIVDDSALVRQLLTKILDAAAGIKVVGAAADPYVARDKIKKLNPDVLTLDVEMPRMDGLTFLGNLMRLRPMPVVMVSSLTEKGADVTLQALENGAVDFVSKPKLDIAEQLPEIAEEIVVKVRMAAKVRVQTLERPRDRIISSVHDKHSADVVLSTKRLQHIRGTERVIGIGSSTGGTEAIKAVISNLPADMPGIVISQHIPEAFSGPFAARVNSLSLLCVMEAKDGVQIQPGHVYIAPGSHHLLVEKSGSGYISRLSDGPPVNRHIPSVDVMFRSLAQSTGANGISVMLTGMGDDGAEGMGEMRAAGALTIAQDEKSSVVWGMPGEAVKRGYVDEVLSLEKIGPRLIELSRN